MSFAAELYAGRYRPELLALPPGDPRRLDEPDQRFLDELTQFCRTVDGLRIERDDRVPDEVITGLRDLGAFCIKIPREYGGLGLSGRCYLRALMIVSTAHPALSELLAAHQAIGLAQPLLAHGTEEQRAEYLPRCARQLSAFALTEAEIGNDPSRMHTTAIPDRASGTYTLNGVKLWTTNGVLADLLVVLAVVPEAGMTAFVVEADAEGVSVEQRCSFLGVRGLENGVIRLHEVVVPASSRIGAEGAGLDIALSAQGTGRMSLPAVCAAAAKWSLKIARPWTDARVQWGKPIGDQEAVAGKLAFIAATAFALEAMVEVTGWRGEIGDVDTGLEAELAKLYASEMAWTVADELVQLRGGRGCETAASAVARGERGVPVEQQLRDLRVGRIFDGSTEALRDFLATDLFAHRSAFARPIEQPAPTDHRGFLGWASRRLDRALASTDRAQRRLGRIVDIGAELYAMAVSLKYAEALSEYEPAAAELADAFCAQARIRVEALFRAITDNTDQIDQLTACGVRAGLYTWLETGVTDPSVDGPWIAEPKPGPPTGPDLRRRIP